MKKFKERILPIGNKFSSDDFRVLYLIFMLKSWNQGIYRDFISVFNIIDILCISDNYEKIPEVFKASRVFTILHGTRFDIDFSYKGKIIHTISLEHQLCYRRI